METFEILAALILVMLFLCHYDSYTQFLFGLPALLLKKGRSLRMNPQAPREEWLSEMQDTANSYEERAMYLKAIIESLYPSIDELETIAYYSSDILMRDPTVKKHIDCAHRKLLKSHELVH